MSAIAETNTSSYAMRAQSLLERVKYRLATAPEDIDKLVHLRYKAYLKEGAIEKSAHERLEDKFDDLAKQSKDPGSREKGGDLGWSSPANYVKPFGDAVGSLGKGKYTETPVKTDFGYHVILLEDSRPLTPPPFDQIKQQIAQRLQQEQLQKFVGELRSKAKVD